MIHIKSSSTADTRTCDWSKVTKDTLLESSRSHISDVVKALESFREMLDNSAKVHDFDKVSDNGIEEFYNDFKTGFSRTVWWDNHRIVNRHHLQMADGVPDDVNLIDVLEMVADCVMAGMARSGSVYKVEIPDSVLRRAFDNTVELLKNSVVVDP